MTKRDWLGAAGLYVLVAGALLWPVLLQFGSGFPNDAGDPVLNTWILWWGTRAFPFTDAWWNGPMFHPALDTMAFSELLVGLLPVSAVVQWVSGNPVAAYNAVFALSFPLCGLTACALAFEITARRGASVAAGLAFMLAPYKMQQLAHLQVLSYYWAPLVLLALHRYRRDGRRRWLMLFAGAWLAQALVNGYAMFHLSILVGLWIVWFMRPLRTAAPVMVAWSVAALLIAPVLWKYHVVQSSMHLVRDINEIKRFGAELHHFLAAPKFLVLWGRVLNAGRSETALFPGLTVVVLAAVALLPYVTRMRLGDGQPEPPARWRKAAIWASAVAAAVALSAVTLGPWAIGPLTVRDFHKPFSIAVGARLLAFLGGPWTRRMWRTESVVGFYVLALAAMYVLALGPEPRLFGRPLLYEPPYLWLMRIPGFDALRVPARFAMLAVLCQAMLVALALTHWTKSARRRTVLPLLVVAGILIDGWIRLPVAAVPDAGVTEWGSAAAVLELPPADGATDFGALYRATVHGRPIVNGFSGYMPPHYLPLAHAVRDRQFAVLKELTTQGAIGIALDTRRGDAAEMTQGLLGAGVAATETRGNWSTFLQTGEPSPLLPLGRRLRIAAAIATDHAGDVPRMLDGDVGTAWGTTFNQIGGEEIVVDLGEVTEIGPIVLEMGSYAFGHPRLLEIETSDDRSVWQGAWRGETSVATVRAAIQQPLVVPLTIDIGRVRGRFLRLRQVGHEPGIPWWIAELRVHSPIDGAVSATRTGLRRRP